MKNQKSLKSHLFSFSKKIEKSGFSISTIESKKQNLSVFSKWLSEEGLEDILPSQFEKKHLAKFKNKLTKKGLSSKTVTRYLKTIEDLIEYLGEKKIDTPLLKEECESDVQRVVNHYFKTKGYSLEDIKQNAKKKKIIYSRYTRAAKDLLELAGSVKKANSAIDKVALWAKSRNLDYAIETVFKKWPEIKNLKPREKKITPFFRGDPMVWSKNKEKWYVINKTGDWLEFAGEKDEIDWKEED